MPQAVRGGRKDGQRCSRCSRQESCSGQSLYDGRSGIGDHLRRSLHMSARGHEAAEEMSAFAPLVTSISVRGLTDNGASFCALGQAVKRSERLLDPCKCRFFKRLSNLFAPPRKGWSLHLRCRRLRCAAENCVRSCCSVGSVPSASSRWLRGPCRRRQARDDFCLPLNHLGTLPSHPRRHPCFYRRNRALYLLVRHGFNPAGMLQLHLPRHQKRADLHVRRRLLLTHLFNRGRPVLFEVGSEREQEILVERSTRSLQGTARVSMRGGPTMEKARWRSIQRPRDSRTARSCACAKEHLLTAPATSPRRSLKAATQSPRKRWSRCAPTSASSSVAATSAASKPCSGACPCQSDEEARLHGRTGERTAVSALGSSDADQRAL